MKPKICTQCGATGKPIKRAPGTFWGELSVWIAAGFLAAVFGSWLLLLPLGYTLYRTVTLVPRCRQCDGTALVPLDSPAGREMQARYAAPAPIRVDLPDLPRSRQPDMGPGQHSASSGS